jgi:hypothetical protein
MTMIKDMIAYLYYIMSHSVFDKTTKYDKLNMKLILSSLYSYNFYLEYELSYKPLG